MAQAFAPRDLGRLAPPLRGARPGVCRVCRCTDDEPCEVGARPARAVSSEAIGDDKIMTVFSLPSMLAPGYFCRWIDRDLCSRCWAAAGYPPTRAQLAEVGRIEARKGPVLTSRGALPGELVVNLTRYATWQVVGGQARPIPAPLLTLDPAGRIKRRQGVAPHPYRGSERTTADRLDEELEAAAA